MAGVVVLVGIGWFVLRALGGGGGGADSPSGAVEQLVAAANKKDLAGAVAALNPDEVDVLGEVLSTVEDRATKTGAAPKNDPWSGFDVKIDGVELTEEQFSDTVVKVEIDDGRGDFEFEPDKLATRVKTLASDVDGGSESVDRDELVVHTDVWNEQSGSYRQVKIDPFVMAVKRGGGWYVSPGLTALQYWVEGNDLPHPDFDTPVPEDLKGASSPEEALREFANSLDEMDVEDWMQYVSAQEREALWAYKDAIEHFIREKESGDGYFSFEVDDLETTEKSLSGGAKALTVTSARGTAQGSHSDEAVDWRYDGRCVVVESADGDEKTCTDRRYTFVYNGVGTAAMVMGSGGVVVVRKENGGWVIDPLASVTRSVKEQVTSASTEELYAWLGVPDAAPATGTLTIGERTTGTFHDGGYAVFDTTLTKGTTYIYQREPVAASDRDCLFTSDGNGDDCDPDLFDGLASTTENYVHRHSYRYWKWGDDPYTELYTPESTGPDRLLVFGKPGTDYSFVFAEVAAKQMPSTGAARGTLTEAEPAVSYAFVTDDGSSTWQIGGDVDEAMAEVRSPGGRAVCGVGSDSSGYYGTSCYLDPGETYFLIVYGQPGAEYDVELTKAGATIDGQQSVSSHLSTGDWHRYRVENSGADAVTVRLEPDNYGVDFDLEFDADPSASCSSASDTSTSDSASVVIRGNCFGTLRASSYRGASGYTLSVENY